MREVMYDTMEAEERTIILEALGKLGMTTKEVTAFLGKQKYTRRSTSVVRIGEGIMLEKIRDNKRDGEKLRRGNK